jgi:hypothetical protein
LVPEGSSNSRRDDDERRRSSVAEAAAKLRENAATLPPALARFQLACAEAMLHELDAEKPWPIW